MSKPLKISNGPVVCFDVDDTLLLWEIPKDIKLDDPRIIATRCNGFTEYSFPNEHNVNLLKRMAKKGHDIIVWSKGGANWAGAVVEALNIGRYVRIVMAKPTYYVDDLKDPAHILGKRLFINPDGIKDYNA